MKRALFVVAMVLLATAFAMGQQSKIETKLIQMDKDWTAAELRGDSKAAGMYIADDYWGTSPDGVLQNRDAYMKDIKASKDTDVADQYSVRVFGDTAIMTHRGTVTGARNIQYRSTHVWMNRGGKWQIVAHHSSEIAAPASGGMMPSNSKASDAAPVAKPAMSSPKPSKVD